MKIAHHSLLTLGTVLISSALSAGCQRASWTYTLGEDASTALSSSADENEKREAIRKICSSATRVNTNFPANFPKPASVCAWNANGNIGLREGHFQARHEQSVLINLPADAIICDLEFEFSPQPLYYDDEFIFTLNSRVLASSLDFTSAFAETSGLQAYDWSRIVGLPWSSMQQSSYCAGQEQGLSQCSFPDTSVNGTIRLEYDPLLIQELFAQSEKRGSHELKWITTGDNDTAVDCLHEPIDALVRVSYVRGI